MHINFEFKARCNDPEEKEARLLAHQPRFVGTDLQTDTYFNAAYGRLKLREGNIENALIHYNRPDTGGAKQSDVTLYQHAPEPMLKTVLEKALGILVVVKKERKIYFIDNVKFHFDSIEGLGRFVEVEAIDSDGTIGRPRLEAQCSHWAAVLGITDKDFIAGSYSDMLLAKKSSTV